MDTKHEKAIDADIRCRQWLAKATDYRERNKHRQADEAERKAQYWLDRLNVLEGNN